MLALISKGDVLQKELKQPVEASRMWPGWQGRISGIPQKDPKSNNNQKYKYERIATLNGRIWSKTT